MSYGLKSWGQAQRQIVCLLSLLVSILDHLYTKSWADVTVCHLEEFNVSLDECQNKLCKFAKTKRSLLSFVDETEFAKAHAVVSNWHQSENTADFKQLYLSSVVRSQYF